MTRLLLTLLGALFLHGTLAAQFEIDLPALPNGPTFNGSSTENIDFADVDLDGDWDAALANGGDDGDDQNRIWINAGHLQGGVRGTFLDETASRAPLVADDSRDIEFVDFDGDGDVDAYVSNTAQISNQGNRWWTNSGGLQGGAAGFFVDETAQRWVGLGDAATGSSIPPGLRVGGSFIDWSCDCDFGDLDGDGDLDLAHSSYGGSFTGRVPTRLFLNDGDGRFSEFNPSGFQLTGTTINDGEPGLWCEGVHVDNTLDATGAECDIASTALDIDLADIDGDFDLDLLHGSRNSAPRMFVNRSFGSSLAPAVGGGTVGGGTVGGGALLFRDVTTALFPSGYFLGNFGHYEQEMGDFDNDGDVDIMGLNWRFSGFNFIDVLLTNDGSGRFTELRLLVGSGSDDNEADFFDMDGDGDLDLYVANFSGQDKLYENDGTGTYSLTSDLPAFLAVTSLDADCVDVDGDGDYDVMVAADSQQRNLLLRNLRNAPDVSPPSIPRTQPLADGVASPLPRVVRAHVYDNAPYYVTWFNGTEVEVSVNGTLIETVPARSMGGQIFRAELPGNLVGSVSYRWSSKDEYGNRGTSAQDTFQSTTALAHASTYGTGAPGTAGIPLLEALSVPFAGRTWYLRGSNAPPTGIAFVAFGTAPASPALALGSFALTNVATPAMALKFGRTDAAGELVVSLDVPATLPPLSVGYAQFFAPGGTSFTWASSEGLAVTSQ